MRFKICFKCDQKKPLHEFYKHTGMCDGHLNKCKDCAKQDATQHRWKNINKVRIYDNMRSKLSHRVEQRKRKTEEFKRNFPIKHAAHVLLNNAVRDGRIVRPTVCSVCFQKKPLEAHHSDYHKPLAVKWLCLSCHRCLHRDLKLKE